MARLAEYRRSLGDCYATLVVVTVAALSACSSSNGPPSAPSEGSPAANTGGRASGAQALAAAGMGSVGAASSAEAAGGNAGVSNSAAGTSNSAGGAANGTGGAISGVGGAANGQAGTAIGAGGTANSAGGMTHSAGGSANSAGGMIHSAGGTANGAGGTANAGGPGNSSGAGSGGAKAFYTTKFDLTESVISEGGVWHHTDPNQAAVQTSDGLVYGTQNGFESQSGNYNDSSAFLTGFPPNQRATAVIHRTSASVPGNLEAELLLRWSEGAEQVGQYGKTTSYGYEINLGQGMYGTFIQIGRWKRLNLFDSMASGSPVSSMGVHDGDIFKAQIVGNTITVWLNETVIATATDDLSWLPATGSPGVGFFRHDSPGPIDPKAHCFSSFTAEGL